MKKIKILQCHYHSYFDRYEDSVNIPYIVDGTDRATISDEEYLLVKKRLETLNTSDVRYVLLEELDYNSTRLTIDRIKKLAEEKEKKRLENEAKRKAKAEKIKKAAAERNKEKELRTFEMLKKKFEEGV